MSRKSSFFVTIAFLMLGCVGLLCSCRDSSRECSCAADAFTRDSLEYAEGFSIERHKDFICVSVRDPWDTLRQRQRYILVDRNGHCPENLPEGTVVKIPVEKAAVYSSVHCAMLEQIGCIDKMCGVCEPQYITSAEILSRVKDGRISDLGLSTSPNVEKMMDLGTEIIIASPFENSGYGAAEKLGIPIVEAADYLESHPLGRTEWLRFFCLLFGREAEGDSIYSSTVARYSELRSLASGAQCRPTVLLERKYGSTWFVPSGNSYIATLHRDAGADYVFSGTHSSANVPLSFETVLDKASDADFWLFKYGSEHPYSYNDLREEYSPYTKFSAFERKTVFACNTVLTSYYDDITLHPDLVLEELIAIYHPELLPNHSFRYYSPLK